MTAKLDKSHTIFVNKLEVHYWESNPTSHRTLVMLHGFRSSHQGLMKMASEFPDYHLIVPDLPGYGATAELLTAHTIPAYAEVIAAFVTTLKLSNVTVMGHSFGALVALAYAAKQPQILFNIVLISPVPRPNMVSRAGGLYYIIGRALPAPLDRQWLTNRFLQRQMRELVVCTDDPVIHAEVMDEGERELDDLRPNINLQNYFSLSSIDPATWLKTIKLPILVVAGDSDRLCRLSDIIATYSGPGIELRIISGMGHFAPAEIPAEISLTVNRWLDHEYISQTEIPLARK